MPLMAMRRNTSDIFRGERGISRGSVMLYPALQWLYAGLGKISSHPWLLLSVSVAGSVLSITATFGIGRRLLGHRAATAGAFLLAIWGNHAFWATSAYNVALPLGLGLAAVWGLLVCAEERESTRAAAFASGAAVLAVSMRIEALLLAPLGLLLFLLRRPRHRWVDWGLLTAGALLSAAAVALVLSAGPLPGGEERQEALASESGSPGFWAPLDGWGGLALLAGGVVGLRKNPRAVGPLLLFLGALHVAISSFNDAGFRHSMLGIWAVALLIGTLADSPRGRVVVVLASMAMLLHTQDVSKRYYLPEEDFGKSLAEAPDFPAEKLSECVLICEDSRVVPEGEQRSHLTCSTRVQTRTCGVKKAVCIGFQGSRMLAGPRVLCMTGLCGCTPNLRQSSAVDSFSQTAMSVACWR